MAAQMRGETDSLSSITGNDVPGPGRRAANQIALTREDSNPVTPIPPRHTA